MDLIVLLGVFVAYVGTKALLHAHLIDMGDVFDALLLVFALLAMVGISRNFSDKEN